MMFLKLLRGCPGRGLRRAGLLTVVFGLAACAQVSPEPSIVAEPVSEVSAVPERITPETPPVQESLQAPVNYRELYPGTGQFLNAAGRSVASAREDGAGSLTLNFDNAPIEEVVQVILGDILKETYVVADGVSGNITLRTTEPMQREALIPVLENLLRMNNAALLHTGEFYEVLPIGDGVLSKLTPSMMLNAGKGYQFIVAPLHYISAKEINSVLEPLKSPKTTIVVDEHRNLLLLGGTQADLINLLETIRLFDVNQVKGKSVGLFRIQNAEASELLTELEAVLGTGSDQPLAGMVSLTPIERLNALLVVTTQKDYLQSVSEWIERLDQVQNAQGVNMYVYHVQNGKAENIADLLTQMFEGQKRLAIASKQAQAKLSTPSAEDGSQQKVPGNTGTSIQTGNVSIIADTENNALLIMATAAEYEEVKKAITRLDILPMQVLVQASIFEVTLEDDLEYGLQWFFNSSHGSFDSRGGLRIPNSGDVSGGLLGTLPNPVDFTYAIFDADGTRALLNATAGDSRVDVLSSPSLLVLDNQKATIRVGDQVPIRTSETEFLNSATGNITSRIEYRDTGVTLDITPRVNNGGMVIMEISLHVDDVDETTSSSIDSPTILQREVQTSVAVQSGESIVLGGLIRQGAEDSSSGVPFLRDIPYLGYAFGGKRISKDKTELVVMITPSAIANALEAQSVTREYKEKLKEVDFSKLR